MRSLFRPTVLITAAAALATAGAPAFATPSTMAPTSLNARATKSVEAPRHQDTVVLTLRKGRSAVTGEDQSFLVRTRRDNGTSTWSSWQSVAATPGATDGRYRITVTMPARIGKGKKQQYQVKFAGDAAKQLRSSRSQVVTVTAS